MSRPARPAYQTWSWPAYNEALKRHGSLTTWLDPAMIRKAEPTGKRGRQPDYSDAAIQTCLTMKVLFGMPQRAVLSSDRRGHPCVSSMPLWSLVLDLMSQQNQRVSS